MAPRHAARASPLRCPLPSPRGALAPAAQTRRIRPPVETSRGTGPATRLLRRRPQWLGRSPILQGMICSLAKPPIGKLIETHSTAGEGHRQPYDGADDLCLLLHRRSRRICPSRACFLAKLKVGNPLPQRSVFFWRRHLFHRGLGVTVQIGTLSE